MLKVEIISDDTDKKSCKATVPDGQLSLAIGNKGQNARLAARLTGWKIDIRPESGFYGEDEEEEEPVVEEVTEEATETEAPETETTETEEPETVMINETHWAKCHRALEGVTENE